MTTLQSPNQKLKTSGKSKDGSISEPKKYNSDKDVTARFNQIFNAWKIKQPVYQKGHTVFAKQLGFSRSSIYDMLKGVSEVSPAVIAAIIKNWNYNYEWIRNGEGDRISGVKDRLTIYDIQYLQTENDKRIQDLLRQAARMKGVENELKDLKKEFKEFKALVSKKFNL